MPDSPPNRASQGESELISSQEEHMYGQADPYESMNQGRPLAEEIVARTYGGRSGGQALDQLDTQGHSASTSLLAKEHTENTLNTTDKTNCHAPANLEPTSFGKWGPVVWDTIVIFVPLFFLVIAVLCIALNGKPVTAYGQSIKAITLLSPTVFPIVYAAILGKALRRIGLFKAERGSTIGTLEQLIGSQSVFSCLERQIGLRRVNVLGVAIIAAWLLSPLGGQASLRLLSTTLPESATETAVHYHKIDSFGNSTFLSEHTEEYYWSTYAPLYMTMLQSSRQNFNGSRDMFGNLRIPDIRSLGANTTASPASSEWYRVSDSAMISYTSLLGNTVVGIPKSGNSTFTIESNYWETQCEVFSDEIKFEKNGSVLPGFTFLDTTRTSLTPSFDLPGRQTNDTTRRFQYITRSASDGIRLTNCTADLRIVESEVKCRAGICDVQRMRISRRDIAPFIRDIVAFDPLGKTHSYAFTMLRLFLPGADLVKWSKASSLTEQWIFDPSLGRILTNYNTAWNSANVSTLSKGDFNQRFQIAVNTFWDSSLGFNHWAVNATSQDSIHDQKIRAVWTPVTAQVTQYHGERYVCSVMFAIFTIAISLLLFMAAIVSTILGFITKAPDILGHVATLGCNNPYFGTPVPSYHNGLEAARALRNTRVIIGDVHKDGHIGHIAFATVEQRPDRVVMDRLYD